MKVTCPECENNDGMRFIKCPDGKRGCAVSHRKRCDHTPPLTLENLEERVKKLEKFIEASEYPLYPTKTIPSKYTCYVCGCQVFDGVIHYCPGPSTIGTNVSGTNVCMVCNEMYPVGGLHSCGGGIPNK